MPRDLSRKKTKIECLKQHRHHKGPSYQSDYLTQILSKTKFITCINDIMVFLLKMTFFTYYIIVLY